MKGPEMGETLLRTSKFDVERREFSFEGKTVAREIAVHPGAAVILPLLDEQKGAAARVVMTRVFRYAVGRELLELPAGTLEPPEPPEACAARELQEETGYRAERIVPLCQFYPSPGILTERMHVFLATGLRAGEPHREESERITVELRSLAEVLSAIRRGEIEDAKTIAAVSVYYLTRGEGRESR